MSDINKIISANDYHEGAANCYKGVNSVNTVNGYNKNWGAVSTNPGLGEKSLAVTPSDSTVLVTTEGLWIGGAGNVAVIHSGNTTPTTYLAVAAGTYLPFKVTKVMSTGTTATSIVAVYNG